MAGNDQGRREVVNDPLAITGREKQPDRSLQIQGVRPPNIGDPTGAFGKQSAALSSAADGLSAVLNDVIAQKNDEMITAGKAAYMSGITEQQINETGNRYQQRGWQMLSARDKVNQWFTKESLSIEEAGKTMEPAAYQQYLNTKRQEVLSSISDPHGKKVAIAAFEDFNPRLASAQTIKNNSYNQDTTYQKFQATLASTARVSAVGTKETPDAPLPLAPEPIAPVIKSDATERDVGIRTLLGEAQNQGTQGMAAVAHVLRNRALDKSGKFPNSIKGAALQPNQFTVWNNGEGGWSGREDNPLYQKAASVYDAVMSGRSVDMTGGATHYYSPSGMKLLGKNKPDWFDSEAEKAGGTVTIGGHVFAGKAAGYSGEGRLKFNNPGQDKLENGFKTILQDTSAAVGRELTITSGHRDPFHPAERNKPGGPGEHANGTASDIDMTGMDDNQRAQLVRELKQRGVKRFGTYTNMPNMMHVDMKDQNGDGSTWFMHDKTNAKMASAPAWIKSVVAEPASSGITAPKQSGTEIQNFIRGFGGIKDPALKAKAVADAVRRELDAGNDQLFRDSGGVSMLRDLRATPGDIDEVLKAKERFDKKKTNEFSADRTKFIDDIKAKAERGASRDEILADIETGRKSRMLDDTHANALATQALDTIRARSGTASASKLDNPELLREVGGLYQAVRTGSADFVKSANAAKDIAKRYGATESDVKSIVGHMFQQDQAYQTELRKAGEDAVKMKAQRDNSIGIVDSAIKRGYGLSTLHGEKIETLNRDGQKVNVTPVEYGVMQIKDQVSKEVSDAVNAGKMDPGKAKGEIMRRTYLQLQQHDVVDKQFQSEIVGALSGNIFNADKTIKNGAVQAYEAYQILANTGNINEGYLSRTIGDDSVRSLLITADRLDSGDLSSEQALAKAHELLNDKNVDINAKIDKDAVWRSKIKTETEKALREKVAPDFLTKIFYNDSKQDANQIIKNNSALAEKYINDRADLYHVQHPNESAEVSMTKAVQDLKANGTAVAGNLIITSPGRELHKEMGISGFGPKAVDDAVKDYLKEKGGSLWPTAYQGESIVQGIYRGMTESTERGFPLLPAVAPRDPPVKITYDQRSGVLSIDMYKDFAKGQTMGDVKHIDAKALGAWWAKKQSDPGNTARAFDMMFEAPRNVGRKIESNINAKKAGAAIGNMIGTAGQE